jgi:hypothetical protein
MTSCCSSQSDVQLTGRSLLNPLAEAITLHGINKNFQESILQFNWELGVLNRLTVTCSVISRGPLHPPNLTRFSFSSVKSMHFVSAIIGICT